MERTLTAEQTAHARSTAEANGRRVDWPVAHAADKIKYTRLRETRGAASRTRGGGSQKGSAL